MEGRKIGTRGGVRARDYLLRAFARIPMLPLGGRFVESFTVPGMPAGTTVEGANIVGFLRGTAHPERYIVISAHYDHLGTFSGEIFHGADDNASGTAGVLAVAQWFQAHPPQNSIIIALFDGEEEIELGSKAFVKSPP